MTQILFDIVDQHLKNIFLLLSSSSYFKPFLWLLHFNHCRKMDGGKIAKT